MLDRPIAQGVRFIVQSVALWPLGLVLPQRLGRQAVTADDALPPPFAWLVLTLFVAGLTLRLFFAIDATPLSEAASLYADLRDALANVSLMYATMLTAPCVLLTAGAAWLLSRVLGSKVPVDHDPIVRAACYAIGWQAGLVTVLFSAAIVAQLTGYEPTGQSNGLFNQALIVGVSVALLWGALILAPAIAQQIRPQTAAAEMFGWIAGLVWMVPVATLTLLLLGQSVDLRAAADRAEARQARAWFGELDIDVLSATPIPATKTPPRLQLTVAYTSRSSALLVVPRVTELLPERAGPQLRVIDSSLDYLPDRALLIEPGETRVAEYTIEPTGDVSAQERSPLGSVSMGSTAYLTPFYRREADGGFIDGRAKLWAPRRLNDVVTGLPLQSANASAADSSTSGGQGLR
ncbi:hypothetical protein Pla111_18330 [Botrimarina hoheduenensis]|uniref:Uncharacterized protein n=2 Tax=Botrimarina hoheduenensis TaxID=2528000 RepID=A0A5C5WAU9_9BACT|nr:hypothetical protein Pla111_18330 [Botrimarina hoheduenensis]